MNQIRSKAQSLPSRIAKIKVISNSKPIQD